MDPLAEWAAIVNRIVVEDISARQKRGALGQAVKTVELLQESSFVLFHDLERHSMSIEELALTPRLYETANRYAMVHTFRILLPLAELLDRVTTQAHRVNQALGLRELHVPFMNEFVDFSWAEQRTIMSRKRWQ